MKKIKRFGVIQTAKTVSLIYFLVMAIFMIPIGIISLVAGGFGGHDLPFFPFAGGIFFFIAPFIYALISFIMVSIGCLIYNLVADYTGGIAVEIQTEEKEF
ncbi:hypothetical protein [Salegentibacter chungangensis]|uniref:DUF3566 domain-containing protein n=1 Tax=Salegentibacter chungangensis TaxID=1335724 RepID=A0ABW3NSL9_9FLAO